MHLFQQKPAGRRVLRRIGLCLTALLLAGCTGVPAESASAGRPAASTAADQSLETRSLVMATPSGALSLLQGDETAAYYLQETGDGAQVMCIDYAARSLSPWTNQPLPQQDVSNPGFVTDTFGGAKPLLANGRLYVLKYGKLAYPNAGLEGSPCRLSALTLDGTARREITLESGRLIEMNSGVAADTEELYLLVSRYDAAGSRTAYELCRTRFDKGTLDVLATLAADARWQLTGVYEKGLLLEKALLPADCQNLPLSEQMQHYTYQLFLYDLSAGSLEPTDLTWQQDEISCVYDTGGVYYQPADTKELHRFDAASGQDIRLPDLQFPAGYEGGRIVLTGEAYGDHLGGYLSLAGSDAVQFAGIDLATGVCTPVTLSYAYDMGQMEVNILAQTETQFLVVQGQSDCPVTRTASDGTPYTAWQTTPSYALMDKADYWQSVPAYEPITDHTGG